MDIIREDFFHFLWQNLHFSQSNLKTTCETDIRILHPGFKNDGDGPDYRLAKICLDGILFCGDIELHKAASEWYRHAHQLDSRYERVILHVVVHDNLFRRRVMASDGHRIPTLELRSSLPASLARLWRAWHRPVVLPCSGLLSEIPEPVFRSILQHWDKRYFSHRLDRMLSLYPSGEPMSVAWKKMLIRGAFQGLGYHKNQENMLRVAEVFLTSEAYNKWHCDHESSHINEQHIFHKKGEVSEVILKSRITKKEAALIRDASRFLLDRAGLGSGSQSILCRTNWDFSASRPANQPTARIPQAAELGLRLARYSTKDWMHKPADKLWQDVCKLKIFAVPGKSRADILFQNVIVPSLYLLGRWTHHKKLYNQAMGHWKKQRIPLPQKVGKVLREGGFPPGNHKKRLALLHQFKYYCRNKRCSECHVMKYIAQA